MPYYVDNPTRTGTPTRIATPTKITNPTRMKLSNLYTANDPADVTIGNTSVETTLATFTIPKENISVGSQLSTITAYNYSYTPGGFPGTSFSAKAYINGTLVGTLSGISLSAGSSGSPVGLDTLGIFSSLGASGTFDSKTSATPITVDTTADLTLTITGQWTNPASDSSFTKRNASATLIG